MNIFHNPWRRAISDPGNLILPTYPISSMCANRFRKEIADVGDKPVKNDAECQ